MKKVAAAVAVAIGLAACGTQHVTAQDKKFQADGAAVVKQCASAANVAHFKSCLAPPGSGPKFQACIAKAVSHGVLTKTQRTATETAVGKCLVTSR